MTRVNLLPWREKYIDIQNRRFGFFCGLVAVLSLLICLLFKLALTLYVSGMEHDRDYLQNELRKAENKMKEVSSLLQTKEALLKRITIIEKLQIKRNLGAQMLDGIASSLPANITLTELICRDDNLKISGVAQNNDDVSNYMKAIDQNSWVADAVLSEIKNNDQVHGNDSNASNTVNAAVKFIIDIKIKAQS